VAFGEKSSTQNELYKKLLEKSNLKVVSQPEKISLQELEKGHITAILNIKEVAPNAFPKYAIEITTSTAAADRIGLLQSIIQQVISELDLANFPQRPTYAFMKKVTLPGREYRTIDFILPGQLGFSLLSAGVFGVAFIFFNLRQTLVLKRFFATPIKRTYIVFGEGIGRIAFQMITAVVILSIGHFAFQFTLIHQWVTFLELMVLSLIGLVVFMGFGFIVSGVAKSESTIPPLANLFTLPQFLLAGTFFSIDNFPSWMQPLCRILPLTHFNNAMRDISFEGNSLMDSWGDISVLLIWIVVVYAAAFKIFKWE
jgi:ABC-2 type transport system permease protein